MALVRAAESEQDAAIFLTAAFTGLRRGELVAVRGRDVDLAAQRIRVRHSYGGGPHDAGERQGVFPGTAGEWLDASALSRR